MDKSIPNSAAHILKFIQSIEAPRGYETIYGNNQAKLPKPITKMTLDEVQKAQPTWTKRFGSSAAGAYQIMRDTMDAPNTMADLEGQMGLSGSELFDADMQDRMAYHLLKRRGYLDFMSDKIGAVAFAKRLAQEWASFPVLAATQGAHRKVARGETYYAGDKLNKALVNPEQIETLLKEAKALAGSAAVPEPEIEPVSTSITDPETVARVQAQLWTLGYTEVGSKNPDGTFDGKIGTMTRSAILAFRNENDLPDGSLIDDAMLARLWTAKPRDISPSRADATPAIVREQIPEARAAWWTKVSAWVAGGASAIGIGIDGILDNLDGARGWLEPLKNTIGDVPTWVWFVILGAGALFLWQKSRKAEVAIQTAYQTGERR